MPLPTPNLDDRDFRQLVEQAKRRVAQSAPEWTDLNESDPGVVLLELFAYLTDTMIYRLNRVPEKAYVEFLNLIGVRLRPPAAAAVELVFELAKERPAAVEIPRGTRVTVGRGGASGEAPLFVLAQAVRLEPGTTRATGTAHHCTAVEAEQVGQGSGLPGLAVRVARPPIVAPTADRRELVVGVETAEAELDEGAPAVEHGGKTYRLWQEVERFTNLGSERHVYVADRTAGVVTFAPAVRRMSDAGELESRPTALAEVPPAGRAIRVWYRSGGGADGNVAAGTLTTLKDPVPGVTVTNPEPATGGRAAESLDNALVRGPQELHSLERAVTSRDFELLALRSSGSVARARALTRAELWAHAEPGTVEVLLVPDLPAAERPGGRVRPEDLRARETQAALDQIRRALDERRPMGTRCVVNWTNYKEVRIEARVVVNPQEDPAAVKRRVLERLHRSVNPLPEEHSPGQVTGWRFGEALRVSHIYDLMLAEPGVRYADRVRLIVDEVPDGEVTALTADLHQPSTWYAGSGNTLFRSLNTGGGWEPAGRFGGETVHRIAVHPDRPGWLAVTTRTADRAQARLHVSRDCGENWQPAAQFAFEIEDLAWMMRGGRPILMLATDRGLFSLAMTRGANPIQVPVKAGQPDLGFYAVAATTHADGTRSLAVAAQEQGGVFLSSDPGREGAFRPIGLKGDDVRVLAVQADGLRRFLWAGAAAEGDVGNGCFSFELRAAEGAPEGWITRAEQWTGGSCHDLAFQGTTVLAGTHSRGVLSLDSRKSDSAWVAPTLDSGLPLREDRDAPHPVRAVAADPRGERLLAGTDRGVFRSRDRGKSYETVCADVFLERVTLPGTWLFCSGEHRIDVVSEDEAPGD